MINDSEVHELFRSKNNYDLVIAELFRSEVFLALGSIFQAPVISVTSQTLYNYHKWMLGNSVLAHSPSSMFEITESMSLVTRAFNMGWNFIMCKNKLLRKTHLFITFKTPIFGMQIPII